MSTVLPVAGSKMYPAEATTVAKWRRRGCPAPTASGVRVAQAVGGGSFSVTLPTLVAAPEVDLNPLREGVVGALPVGVGVGVGDVARRVAALRRRRRGRACPPRC